jgi:PKD repeat protein
MKSTGPALRLFHGALATLLIALGACAQPVLRTPPQSVSRINGFPAWFSVTATGAPPVTFQWRRGTTNLAGATSNVFGWPAVQPGNAGTYDVVITNPGGAITSAPVSLTVTPNTAGCAITNLGLIPLNELGSNPHKGYPGGLYPNGLNQRPRAHDEAGRFIARSNIQPRAASGAPDPQSGRIGLLSIGMSNTTQEWAAGANDGTNDATVAFRYRATNDPSRNPRLAIVDGAQGGMDAPQWTNANAGAWLNVPARLTAAGVTSNQVQVIWIKQAIAGQLNFGAFPAHALLLQDQLENILRAAQSRFPHLRLVYLSSRTRSYAADNSLNPEPAAYEGGFAVKWLIEKQLQGQLNFDPARGPVEAPWLAWGPYLWADGLAGRSDGFTWACSDLRNDYTHPSQSGVTRVADQLLNFFKTDPTATPWFLRTNVSGAPPTCAPTAGATAGLAPLTVNFAANASDANGTVVETRWTFDDGTFATNANPVKRFLVPGAHTVRLTVMDNLGNTTTSNVTVNVSLTYDRWREAIFPAAALADPAVSGPDADADGDSTLNFAEYALGHDPQLASRAGLPTADWTTLGAARYLTVTIPRNAAATDVRFQVEVSDDLQNWFSGPAHTTTVEDSPALWRVRDNLAAQAGQRFLRVTVIPGL